MNFPEDSLSRLTTKKHFVTPELYTLLAFLSRDGDDSDIEDFVIEDQIPVELHNVSFGYIGGEGPTFESVNLSIKQGTFVGVIGAASTGKNTLLQIISQVLVPQDGNVMSPAHLRVLHVSHEVLLLKSSSLFI